MALMRKRFSPNGGLIIPTSTLISTRMPNHTSTAPWLIPRSSARTSGMNTGRVSSTMASDSMKQPRTK